MKKIIRFLGIMLFVVILSSCSNSGADSKIGKDLSSKAVDRVAITNARYAGRYTISEKKGMDRFVSYLQKAKIATEDSGLDPDFVFDIYSGDVSLGKYKYIAGLTDSDKANLIDMNGKLYRVSRSIEDVFMKRLMKKNDLKNVPEYYISLINTIIEKTQIPGGSKIVADIGNDYAVTKSITSVEQESILKSINDRGITVTFPSEKEKYSYSIEVRTGKYSNTSSEAIVTVRGKEQKVTKYEVSGNYKSGDWEFHIKFK
ncbi:MAG: hypothetical protein RR645_03475 [Clostridium sp.]